MGWCSRGFAIVLYRGLTLPTCSLRMHRVPTITNTLSYVTLGVVWGHCRSVWPL